VSDAYDPEEAVIIASHRSSDPAEVQKAMQAGCRYIAMIGSQKRANQVREHLSWSEEELKMGPVFIPAGFNLQARNPEEIALSIVGEILQGYGEKNGN
jgi:xanthine dehydrogenase accessory factor